MVAAVALAVLLIVAAVLVVFGVLLCAGAGVASIVAGVLLAGYALLFLAEVSVSGGGES